MAQLKNKKMIQVAIVLGCILLAVVFFLPEETIVPGSNTGDITIETEYCDLYYPARWEDIVKIDVQGNRIVFQADFQRKGILPLFDISFGDADGTLCGTIETKNGETMDVCLTVHSLSPKVKLKQENLDVLYAMLDDVNYLCGKLPIVKPSQSGPIQQMQAENIEISTPYGTLTYPGIWQPYLRMNVSDNVIYSIEFYANVEDHPEQHLFDVYIGPYLNGQYQMGLTEDGTVVTLDLLRYPPELDDTWSESQADVLYGMLDDAYLMVQDLVAMQEVYSAMEDDTAENKREYILVETPYGDVRYPGKWKNAVRIETDWNDSNSVYFYGNVDGYPEQHLFTLAFGGEEGIEVGAVADEEGNVVNVYIIPGEISGPDGPQKDLLYSMQEDFNYLMESLPLES